VITDTASTVWLLDNLIERVPSAQHAIVLSVDGLLTGASTDLPRIDAEHLAAIASGFAGLARTAGRHFRGGPVRQTIVEMEQAFLFVTAASNGSCLAVWSTSDADIGLIAYEMALLVERFGQIPATAPRPAASRSDAQHPDTQHPDTQHPDAQHPDAQHPDAQHPDAQRPVARRPVAQRPAAQRPAAHRADAG
jgi:predicted regulator of Ras-like GTPase activity (Roadblock/LC7/MglB family)